MDQRHRGWKHCCSICVGNLETVRSLSPPPSETLDWFLRGYHYAGSHRCIIQGLLISALLSLEAATLSNSKNIALALSWLDCNCRLRSITAQELQCLQLVCPKHCAVRIMTCTKRTEHKLVGHSKLSICLFMRSDLCCCFSPLLLCTPK